MDLVVGWDDVFMGYGMIGGFGASPLGGSPFGAGVKPPMGGGPPGGVQKRVMPNRGAPVASPTIPITSPGQVRRPMGGPGPSRAVEAPKRVPSGPLPPTRGAPPRGRGNSRREGRPMASSDGMNAPAGRGGLPPRGTGTPPGRGAVPIPRGRRGGPPGAAPLPVAAAGSTSPSPDPRAPVGHKFCIECGVPRVPGSKFCGECGFRF